MRKILLVSHASGIKDELGKRLKSEPQEFTVYQPTNAKEARSYLEEHYDLAIVDLHVPADVDALADADKTPGLDLVKWMRQSGIEMACILVRPTSVYSTPELDAEIGELSRCTSVQQGPAMFEDLLKVIKKLLSGEQQENREVLEIELRLSGGESRLGESTYSILLTGAGSQTLVGKGALSMDDLDIDALVMFTDDVASLPERRDLKWKRRFRAIGQRLSKMLRNNADFYADVKEALQKIGHPKDYSYAHLRFVIPRSLHAIALEAVVDLEKLRDEDDDSDLWMLEAPVYRVLYGEDVRNIKVGPLFTHKSARPIRCLLIDANVDSDEPIETDEPDPRNPEAHLFLGHLPLVSEECNELNKVLKEEMQSLNIAEPVLLRREPGEQGYWQRVQDQLKHDWDLVHYAGHSYYHEEKNRACVFFQEDDHHVKPLTITHFANQLRSARLVFLSSCQSASEGFVFELAESGVPAIIGFRWPIEDSLAVGFAQCFYEHLFKSMSVEEAFFMARCQMHDKQKKRKVWASPVLIEQKI
jgi:hypothetical protein